MSAPARPAASGTGRRGVLIYNPIAGQRNRRPAMHALIDKLRSEGVDLANAPTAGPGHATRIVRDLLPENPDIVAVCETHVTDARAKDRPIVVPRQWREERLATE